MEINSDRRLTEDEMFESDWENGYCFDYLKRESPKRFLLKSLHTDNEYYSFDGDSLAIRYCPMCGRKLAED